MSLNESIVEDAALEWFGDPPASLQRSCCGQARLHRLAKHCGQGMGYAAGHGPHLAPGEPAAERESFSEVVLVGRLREAIRRLNPAISSHTHAPLRDPAGAGRLKLLSGELNVANLEFKLNNRA